MKTTKRMLSTVLAILCSTSSLVSMKTVATYDPCDVNHDGNITILDAIIVSQYLSGNVRGNEYNQLDANMNLLVDYEDFKCVLAAVTELSYSASFYSKRYSTTVSFPAITGTTLDPDASLTAGRTYRRYSYVTNSQLSNYTLYPNTDPINTSGGNYPDTIIDGESRTYSYGDDNKAIVALTSKYPGVNGFGTGFIVGNHAIATAAHCVCKKTPNNSISNVSITFPYDIDILTHNWNGTTTGVQLSPVEVHIPNNYCQDSSENYYDYALIIVEEDLSNYPQFSVTSCYNRTAEQYSSIPIIANGCPGQLPGTTEPNSGRRLYYDEGRILDATEQRCIDFSMDISSGQSGCPFYTITKSYSDSDDDPSYSYSALGITTHGAQASNFGVRFTKYHNSFYGSNPKITEALNSIS